MISYLMPKKEFECLTGKKQPRAVSVKSQEVPTKKLPTPRRHAKPETTKKMSASRKRSKPKRVTEKQERSKKAKSPDREKTRGKWVKKKCRVHEPDPCAWGMTTEIQKWGGSEPSPKKSKKENAEKYFDDVPKKKAKVSRLMKFMDRNKDFVQVNDDFEILIRNMPIPGSDFIEIMNYLQKEPIKNTLSFQPEICER